jgi:hypothetical protein
MRIAIVASEGFNAIGSFIASAMLNRVPERQRAAVSLT